MACQCPNLDSSWIPILFIGTHTHDKHVLVYVSVFLKIIIYHIHTRKMNHLIRRELPKSCSRIPLIWNAEVART